MATRRVFAYTNAQALSKAAELLAQCGDSELVEKLQHMAAQASKPSKKSDAPTKGQIINLALARKVAQFVWQCEDELVTSKLVVTTAGIPEIITTQKASYLLGLAGKQGWLQRHEVKSNVYWGKGEVNPAE